MVDQNASNGSGHVVPFVPRPRNGSTGPRPEGTRIRSLLSELENEPELDLAAVQADDELIDSLSSGSTRSGSAGLLGHLSYGPDDHITSILAAWKAEVEADPFPDLIDVDTAAATIRAGARRTPVGARHLASVAAAVATIVLGVGGVSVGSAAAQPNTFFWPVSKVLFHERAASIEAADRAEQHIARAKVALTEGRPAVAAQELQQAQVDLGQVRPQEGHADLADVQSFLVAKAIETSPGASADLRAPLRSDPDRKVPSGTALTEDPDPSVVATPVSTAPSDLPAPATVTPGPPVSDTPPKTTVSDPATGTPTSAPTTDPLPGGSDGGTGTSSPASTATASDTPDPSHSSAATTTSGLGVDDTSSTTPLTN